MLCVFFALFAHAAVVAVEFGFARANAFTYVAAVVILHANVVANALAYIAQVFAVVVANMAAVSFEVDAITDIFAGMPGADVAAVTVAWYHIDNYRRIDFIAGARVDYHNFYCNYTC